MQIDTGGASFIAAAIVRKCEGLSLAPYFCPAGKETIGYGHVILPGESWMRAGIDSQEAEFLLLKDLAWAMYSARQVGRVLMDGQAAALASLVFNIGRGAFEKSTLRALVVAGEMVGAAAEFGRWNKAGGRVLPGLVKRRALEAQVFQGVLHELD